jgi:pimeloyl-ACP methyl ester carboxylesterase
LELTIVKHTDLVRPFALSIDEETLIDLRRRLAMTRWPEASPVAGWQQGVPLTNMQRLCDHWANRYDWRRCETMLNGFGQFRTVIDGVGIHFLHKRSPQGSALPLLLTHGWPGSVIEFSKVIDALADPLRHGGDAIDAFDVIVPSLPGYGFSDNPPSIDWSHKKIATAWITLMRRLGYSRFVAQGGDWGAAVTTEIAIQAPPELAAIHLNMASASPEPNEELSASEKQSLADLMRQAQSGRGYSEQHRTKPQTLGYGLADSPAGQAAWIYDKFRDWSDCDGDPLNSFSADDILDNIMLYWLPNHGASSARLYATEWPKDWLDPTIRVLLSVPLGYSSFPKEIFRPARRWIERKYGNLTYWNEMDRGGHFAAFECPEGFIGEMRRCFRAIR